MWMHTLQILFSLLCGLSIGIERQIHGSKAGIRTCALVCMGSCLFALTSTQVLDPYTYKTFIDPTRIAAQVVSGIGFVGGGVIFRDQNNTRGLTTAAIIWVSAAIGIAIAFKMFFISMLTTIICILILTMNKWSWLKKYLEADVNETKIID